MNNLLDPAILFFAFGMLAGAVKSNLEIPQPIARFLSLYLLMALGLKGGFALSHSGLTQEVGASLLTAVALALTVPLVSYQLLKRIVSPFDAAALSATYGSVSAVTFVTATQFLENQHIGYGGHMAAAMALMESPAILIAVTLSSRLRQTAGAGVQLSTSGQATLAPNPPSNFWPILRESFTEGTQLLLLGAMVIGMLTGDTGKAAMQPFSGDLFKGMLAFFLLDMGLLTAKNLGQIRHQSPWLVAYALLAPLVHASVALLVSTLIGISLGNTILLMVLAASASYIAVPAVIRHAIPEAQPALYFGLSLGVTFPFNLMAGIPLYSAMAQAVAS